MNISRDYDVRVNKVGLNANRFGRIQPIVWFDSVPNPNGGIISSVSLPTIEDMIQNDYAGGDTVKLKIQGSHYRLGGIVQKADEGYRWETQTIKEFCYHCQEKLRTQETSLYCPNPYCPQTAFSRLVYGARTLNLPFSPDDIACLYFGRELIQDIPSMLFLTADHLVGPNYGRDEAEWIAEILDNRVGDLLNPDKNVQTEVTSTREKVLDTLSIPGLFQADRQKILDRLNEGVWRWEDLPSVLTIPRELNRLGIDKSDVRKIVTHTRHRVEELDAISRTF